MLKRLLVGLAIFVVAMCIVDAVVFAHGTPVTPNSIIADSASRLDAAFVQATTARTPTDVFRAMALTFVAVIVPLLWLLFAVFGLFVGIEAFASIFDICRRKINR